MKEIKIFVLGTRGIPGLQGGVEKHCEELYPRLQKLGCSITVFCRSSYFLKNKRVKSWKNVNLKYFWVPRLSGLEAFMHTLIGLFYSFIVRPNIIHIHAIGPSIVTPIAKLFNYKVVVTNHGPDYERSKWGKFAKFILKLGEFLSTKYGDKIIVISKGIRNVLVNKYRRKDVEVIPNGVFYPKKINSINTLKKYNLLSKNYIFTACRITPEKGILDLIEAYNKINSPHYKLVIAGKSDSISSYSKKIKKIVIKNDNIIMTGFLTGIPLKELYYNAGLFVLPSYYEGLPIALLEALSYNLPVLVSDIPANLELLLPEYRYFKTGSIDELTQKIPKLFELSISEEEKSYYKLIINLKYNWDNIAQQIYDLYKKIS